MPSEVHLFGSRARGDWDGYSDTDLLVVAEAAEQAERVPDRLRGICVGDDVLGQLVDGLERLGVDVESTTALPLKALSRMSSRSRCPIEDTPPADLFKRADGDLAIGTAGG